MSRFVQHFFVACFLVSTSTCFAQDDVADQAENRAAQVEAAKLRALDKRDAFERSREDSHLRQLNIQAGQGGQQLAVAIKSLARIGEPALVDYWLETGVQQINDAKLLGQMGQTIGSDVLFKIASDKDLSAASRASLEKLKKAYRDLTESPQRIQSAIQALSGSTDQKLDAFEKLLAGGNESVKAMVAAATEEGQEEIRDDLLRTLLALGEGGAQSLEQIAIYGKQNVRLNALKCLVRINSADLNLELLTAAHASDSSEAEKEFASNLLVRRVGYVPNRSESLALLGNQLRRVSEQAKRTENSKDRTVLWSIGQDRVSVDFQSVLSIHAKYRAATDAASRLRRIGNLPANLARNALIADMSYRVIVDPDWGDPAQVQQIRESYGSIVQGAQLTEAISQAFASDDDPSIVGLFRLIDSNTDEATRKALLQGSSPMPTGLINAVHSPSPRVRYEAAAAVVRISGNQSYPGKSYVLRCLHEMSELRNRPMAMLVETRSEVILTQEKILSSLGFDVVVVDCVAQAEAEIAKGNELHLVVSKTNLFDHPPVELIDRVRRSHLGARVPILFYGETNSTIESLRWNGFARKIEQPKSPDAYVDLLYDLDLQRRMPELTTLDRRAYRGLAAEFLSQ